MIDAQKRPWVHEGGGAVPMTDKEEIKDGVVEEFYNKGQFKFRRNPKFEIPDELHYTDAVHRNQWSKNLKSSIQDT